VDRRRGRARGTHLRQRGRDPAAHVPGLTMASTRRYTGTGWPDRAADPPTGPPDEPAAVPTGPPAELTVPPAELTVPPAELTVPPDKPAAVPAVEPAAVPPRRTRLSAAGAL